MPKTFMINAVSATPNSTTSPSATPLAGTTQPGVIPTPPKATAPVAPQHETQPTHHFVAASQTHTPASAPHMPPGAQTRSLLDPTDPPRTDVVGAAAVPTLAGTFPPTASTSAPPTPLSRPLSPVQTEAKPDSIGSSNFPPTPPAPGSGSNSAPKKGMHFSPKLVVSAIVFALMIVGGAAGFYLTQQNQDLRQQASKTSSDCRQVGESWNECCGEGLSKKVTCSGVGGSPACCNAWDVGACNQQDGACGTPPGDGGNPPGSGGGGSTMCTPGSCKPDTERCWSDNTIACIKCNEQGNGWESSVQGTGRACTDGGADDGTGRTCADVGVPDTGKDRELCTFKGGQPAATDSLGCAATGGYTCQINGGLACAYADPRQDSCGTIGGGASDGSVVWEGNTLVNNSSRDISATVCKGPDPDDNPGCPISNNCSSVPISANGGRYTISSQCEQVDAKGGEFPGKCVETNCSPNGGVTPPPENPPAPETKVSVSGGVYCTAENGSLLPIDNANIALHNPSGMIGDTLTANGTFSFPNMPLNQTYAVRLNQSGSVTVKDGSNNGAGYSIEVSKLGTLFAQNACAPKSSSTSLNCTNQNQDGKYRVNNVPNQYAYCESEPVGNTPANPRPQSYELCYLSDAAKTQNGNFTFVFPTCKDTTPPPVVQTPPDGYHDRNTCDYVLGWACDKDNLSKDIAIHYYLVQEDGSEIKIGESIANLAAYDAADASAIGAICGSNTNRRYMFPLPATITHNGTVIPVRNQVGKKIKAFAINIDKNGAGSHVGDGGNGDNKQLSQSPIAIQLCDAAAGVFNGVCTNPVNGGPNYTFTLNQLSGTLPFMYSRVFLSFPESRHVPALKEFLGAPTWDLPASGSSAAWYGYQVHQFGSSAFTPGVSSLTWQNTPETKIGLQPTAKSFAQLRTKLDELLASTSVSSADKTKLRQIRIEANLASGGWFDPRQNKIVGGSQTDYIGGISAALDSTACSQPIGPMCMLITAHKVTNNTPAPTPVSLNTLRIGDQLQFKCGANTGAPAGTTYEYRVLRGDKTLINNLQSRGTYSETFAISAAGTFYAQCRICVPTGTSGAQGEPVCQPWYDPANLRPTQARPPVSPVTSEDCPNGNCAVSGTKPLPGATNGPVISGGGTSTTGGAGTSASGGTGLGTGAGTTGPATE